MSLKNVVMLTALSGMFLPAVGCGGHKPGIVEGVDEPTPPQTQQEIDVERKAQQRKGG